MTTNKVRSPSPSPFSPYPIPILSHPIRVFVPVLTLCTGIVRIEKSDELLLGREREEQE